MKPTIVFCDNHLLVAKKPHGMLTQPDQSGDESLEVFAKDWLKHKFNKPGAVFLHAIHRLDRPAGGLVLFARTSKALSRLNEQMRSQAIRRFYRATVEGALQEQRGQLEHYLIHGDHEAILSEPGVEGAKRARLVYHVVEKLSDETVVEIELETGRYHQIRAQFAAIGHPVLGDKRYGAAEQDQQGIALWCIRLSFEHPVTHQVVTVELPHSNTNCSK